MNDSKYIGLGVHHATISAAVRDSAGKFLMESILETKGGNDPAVCSLATRKHAHQLSLLTFHFIECAYRLFEVVLHSDVERLVAAAWPEDEMPLLATRSCLWSILMCQGREIAAIATVDAGNGLVTHVLVFSL